MQVTIYNAGDEFTGTPLGNLPIAVVDADGDRPFGEVLEAAGHERHHAFNLITPAVEDDLWATTESGLVIAIDFFGVDEHGRIRFSREITWAEFVRAVEAGFYKGDPSRIVVYSGGLGGGPNGDGLWQAVLWLFENREFIGWGAGGIAGTVAGVDWLDDRRRRLIGRRWRKQGFTAGRIRKILREVPAWDPVLFATRFHVTEAEARRALANAGYRPNEDGLWEPSTAPDGRALADGLKAIEDDAWANWEIARAPEWLDDDPDEHGTPTDADQSGKSDRN